MAEGEPPAKRRHRCSNRSDFLEEEEWSEPVECSTPVWQLDESSFEFDPKEELEGSFLDGDANGIASSPGHSQILSCSHGENWEKAWDHGYVTGRK